MKSRKKFIIGSDNNTANQASSTNATPVPTDPGDQKKRWYHKATPLVGQVDGWGIVRGVIAFIIGALAYYGSKAILPADSMWAWVRFLCALVIALLVLWIFDRTQKDKTPFREAVVIAVFLLFFYDIAMAYFIVDKKDGVEQAGDQTSDNQLHGQILKIGRTVYMLQPNEETKWLGLPEDGSYHYVISSPDYNHDIIFTDGSVYPDGEKVVIPKKKHQYFKVRANNIPQVVTIVVTKN
jgi:hypothetical protein